MPSNIWGGQRCVCAWFLTTAINSAHGYVTDARPDSRSARNAMVKVYARIIASLNLAHITHLPLH